MIWDSDPLFDKAKAYIEQGHKHDPEDRFYVYWHLMAFELLIKSCLAKCSKCLLADGGKKENILFALGFEKSKIPPKQRSITELLDLSKTIITEFNDEDYKKALVWMEFRNEEVHSGTDRLTAYAQSSWQGDFYKISKKLLNYLKKSIGDLFGSDSVSRIEKIISELSEETEKEVKKDIAHSKIYYSKMRDEDKEKIRSSFKRPPMSKVTKCPACEEEYAVIIGDVVATGEPKLEGNDLVTMTKILPTELKCIMCNLDLKGFSRVNNTGLGAEFTVKEYVDPVDYLGIDIESEYQNMYPENFHDPSDEYMDE